MENRKIQDENYILWNGHSYIKPPTHRKPKKVYTMGKPNAQLGHKTATIAQTFKPALHQTYRICNWLKHIYMRKQKTHFHPVKKTLKDKCKHQLKEENTDKDREHKREQNKCVDTEQGNNQSK